VKVKVYEVGYAVLIKRNVFAENSSSFLSNLSHDVAEVIIIKRFLSKPRSRVGATWV
jgi:hypothetical protein